MSKIIRDQLSVLRKKDMAEAIAPIALEWGIYAGVMGGVASLVAGSCLWAHVLMCAMLGTASGLVSMSIVAAVMGGFYERRLAVSEPELERLRLHEGV